MIKIDFLKKKKVFVKTNTQPNPNVYWMAIFYLGFILTVAAFIFGFYLFVKVNQEEALPPLEKNEQLDKISKSRIDKVLEYFKEREKVSTQIINSPSPVVDPSF